MPEIETFLSANGWQGAKIQPLAGDMSTRRYLRVSRHGKTAVLMMAQTGQQSFIDMTGWLLSLGLRAPDILAVDPDLQLVLLGDLGDVSLRRYFDDAPHAMAGVFHDLSVLLLTIRRARPPKLAQPSAPELVTMTRLADEFYPGIEPEGLTGFRSVLQTGLDELAEVNATVSLRDFHSENIQWQAGETGLRQFGLLDYQDAFLVHPVYDVMSILTDARRAVSAAEKDQFLSIYLAQSGDDGAAFRKAFSLFSAQRNLRILGIFARAGRHSDLALPYRYFCDAMDHPVFADIRDETIHAIPTPRELAT